MLVQPSLFELVDIFVELKYNVSVLEHGATIFAFC